MFCGLDRPSWVDPRRLPGAFQELWTAEFQENNALLLGKENEALGPFWKSHGNRFCFFADFSDGKATTFIISTGNTHWRNWV